MIKHEVFKIAILGPESSGKTTLSESLSKHFDATLSEEFARKHLNDRGGKYKYVDLDTIATHQFASNNQLMDQPLLIADTEMLTIKIWSAVKYGKVSSVVLDFVNEQKFDLYLLCKPDLPWEEDPLREHPTYRDELFKMYQSELASIGANFKVIEGDNRTEKAINFCNAIF